MTESTPERPASERLFTDGGYLVEDVGHHTCGAGGEWPHEPSCGLVPVIPLADLDEQMRARSRFAARVVGPAEPGADVPVGMKLVELYAGERYEHPRGRPSPRRPVGAFRLTAEQAEDLLLALGEPEWVELPERLRPPRESLWEGL